jgi:hypothetical protein
MQSHSSFEHAGHAPTLNAHDHVEIALRCHQECTEALQYCFQHGGEHSDPHHLKLLQTCAELSHATARLMMIQSPYHQALSDVCARVCLECAKSCEELHDTALTDCAYACVQCAEACTR